MKEHCINPLAQRPDKKTTLWKKLFHQYAPTQKSIEQSRLFQKIAPLLQHSPHYWHVNIDSVSRAAAIGLFCAFMLIPFQTILAITLGILFRANLPLSMGIIWINNPLTMGPMYYLCYRVGTLILHMPLETTITYTSIIKNLPFLWQPFLLGTFVTGLLISIVGYCVTRWVWKIVN